MSDVIRVDGSAIVPEREDSVERRWNDVVDPPGKIVTNSSNLIMPVELVIVIQILPQHEDDAVGSVKTKIGAVLVPDAAEYGRDEFAKTLPSPLCMYRKDPADPAIVTTERSVSAMILRSLRVDVIEDCRVVMRLSFSLTLSNICVDILAKDVRRI